MKITPHTYQWAYPLTTRQGKPRGTVWHNAAATHCTVDDIHSWHRFGNGWSGIAYHFFVDKEGKIWRGRPENKLGGHTLGGSSWLGICCEGNYDREKEMPKAQLLSCIWLHNYINGKYGKMPHVKHRDMPGNATSCPGRFFPWGKIVA